jgi:hypothetical protein
MLEFILNNGRFVLRRFHFDDEEEEGDDEYYGENIDPQMFSVTHFPPSEDIVMKNCIKICESYIFWNFLSLDSKLSRIKKTYNFLISLEEDLDS